MPSFFDQLCSTHLDPIIDKQFGETVRFMPMIRTPNGRAAPDPARAVTETTAVVHLMPHRPAVEHGARSAGRGASNDLHSLVNGTKSLVSVQARLFANPADRPRQGDRIECATGRFEIVSAQPDGNGRIVCQLASIGRPSE